MLSAYDAQTAGGNAIILDEFGVSIVYGWPYEFGMCVTFGCPMVMACDGGTLT